MIGKQVAHYQILEKIGQGGMGEVYRALDTKLDREVAVKSLPPSFVADADYLARFEREAKVLAGLNHTGIGAIYGIEEVDDSRFLILELIQGQDLSALIASGPIPVDEVVYIALQIAESLEVAHEQGIVHRDLKPGNIKITPEGKVKVLDFGLAKSTDKDDSDISPLADSPTMPVSTHTASGMILGTAAYMSPEQARGHKVDKRADIFAFGAVVMEMLTGKQVFPGNTVSDILAAVLRAEPHYDELPANAPPALTRLLKACLEKDARRRVRDIGDARITLEDIRSGAADPLAEEPGASSSGFIQKYSGWIATAIVVIGAAIMMATTQSNSPAPPQESLWITPLAMHPDDIARRRSYYATISPDGNALAYLQDDRIWVREFSKVDPYPLAGTEGATGLFWSYDSQWLGYSIEQSMFKVPRTGGQPSLIVKLPSNIKNAGGGYVRWNENDVLIFSTASTGLLQVSAHGGDITSFLDTQEGESDFHAVELLPDNHGILFVVHTETGYGKIDGLKPDGTRTRLIDIEDPIDFPVYSPSGHILYGRGGRNRGIWAFPFSPETMERTGDPFLVSADGRFANVSRDGTLSYTKGTGTRPSQLAWFDRSGSLIETLGEPIQCSRPFPSISPDGKSAALALDLDDGRELFLIDLASGSRRRLTFVDTDVDFGEFTPDGRGVVYDIDPEFLVQCAALDGTARDFAPTSGLMPTVTRDGTTLVFATKKPDAWDWDIHRRPLFGDQDETVGILVGEGNQWDPSVSPDGRWLAYSSDETGQFEIFVTTFPDPGPRWQISSDGGQYPQWTGDGSELFYTTFDAIYSVEITPGEGFIPGTPKKLFDRPTIRWSRNWTDGFGVTDDGRRFLFVAPAEGDEAHPTVVVTRNWHLEFE